MNTKNILLNWRFLLISSAVICALIAIVFKVLSIQFIDSSFLKDEGNKRYIKYKDINPVRGTIFDRNNFPLAVSIVNYDLYALSGFKKSQLLSVAEVIDIDVDINKDIFIKKFMQLGANGM